MKNNKLVINYAYFLVNEWYKHADLLNLVIKALWEANGMDINRKTYTPKNVVYVSANLSPEVRYNYLILIQFLTHHIPK